MKSKKIRIIIDIVMTVLLYALMAYHYTGQLWHEITGTGMFILFAAHNFINRGWYKALGKGKYSAARVFQVFINICMMTDVLLLVISGIAMSRYVFRFVSLPVSMMLSRTIHMVAAYAGFLLMSLHIGLHFGVMIRRVAGRANKYGILLMRLLAITISVYGAYALHKRNFFGYISGSTMFAFFDYSELPVLFFLDYAAIMGLMIFIAYYLQKFFTGGIKANMSKLGNHIKNHKKRYLIILIIIAILVVVFFAFGRTYIRRHYQTVSVNREQATQAEKVDVHGKKGIIVYFTRVGNTNFDADVDAVSSASLMEDNGTLIGNSELLSEMIASATGYSTYAITTKKKYSSSYGDTVSEAREEMSNNTVTEFEGTLPDFSEYDSIILVYPLWWGTLPVPVQTFLSQTDWEGKTVYSLVTHGGSGFGTALTDTKKYTRATVSEKNLEVYDDDVVNSLEKVTTWVKQIAGDN